MLLRLSYVTDDRLISTAKCRKIVVASVSIKVFSCSCCVTYRWRRCGKLGEEKGALRAQLYGLGYPRQPSPRATLAEVTFSLFLSKIQPAVYIRIANSSRGARRLGWASCLTSAGRVTLASGTTFRHINALADRDISRRGECHVMLRFRIYSRNSYQRSKN